MTLQSCPLTFMGSLCHVHPSRHTHNNDDDELIKFKLSAHVAQLYSSSLQRENTSFLLAPESTCILLTVKQEAWKKEKNMNRTAYQQTMSLTPIKELFP